MCACLPASPCPGLHVDPGFEVVVQGGYVLPVGSCPSGQSQHLGEEPGEDPGIREHWLPLFLQGRTSTPLLTLTYGLFPHL